MNEFSHLNTSGQPAMVNVSEKAASRRRAVAQAIVCLPPQVLEKLEDQELKMPKGPVFQTAVIAGVMAAKRTGELIPLCHPLGLEDCQIHISINAQQEVVIDGTAVVTGKTGVEMEAMTAVSIAALTIYDMCKALSHDIVIRQIRLMEKTGGKRDFKHVTDT
jgi:cyclic pyranopterin monophosphate synthase